MNINWKVQIVTVLTLANIVGHFSTLCESMNQVFKQIHAKLELLTFLSGMT